MDARTELADILNQTRDYLNALLDDGVSTLEIALPERGQAAAVAPAVAVNAAQPAVPKQAPGATGSAAASSPAAPGLVSADLQRIAAAAAACTKCALHKTRTRAVPGQGHPHPRILFVGEAPGEEEDRQGLSFVGPAGQLLTQMIEAMGFKREDVFIANILKCRPPGNRTPLPDERAACLPYLREQIAALKPDAIVALGGVAAQSLLHTETGITRLRGTWSRFEGIDVMPTFHPSHLLHTPSAKREAWADLQDVCRRLGHTPPPVKKKPAGAP